MTGLLSGEAYNAKYGPAAPLPKAPRADSVRVTGVEMTGVDPKYVPRLLQLMRFQANRYYTAPQLSAAIRQVLATRYFRRITYGCCPWRTRPTRPRLSLRCWRPRSRWWAWAYTTARPTGIGLLASLSARDLLLPGSTTQAKINIGENPRAQLSKFTPYTRTWFAFAQYLPLTKSATLLLQAQAGLNFNYKQAVFNDFVVGGLTSVVRNQVTFAGLPEASLLTGSVASALVGYQYALSPSLVPRPKPTCSTMTSSPPTRACNLERCGALRSASSRRGPAAA